MIRPTLWTFTKQTIGRVRRRTSHLDEAPFDHVGGAQLGPQIPGRLCRTITARANRFPVVAPSARAASAPGKGGKRPRPVRGSRLDIHKQAYITHRDPSLTPKSSWHMVSRKDKVEIGNSG